MNICDIHGERPLRQHIAYSVSKSALIALTRSTALELGECGVRVNGVSPGAISWVQGKHDQNYKRDTISKTALRGDSGVTLELFAVHMFKFYSYFPKPIVLLLTAYFLYQW